VSDQRGVAYQRGEFEKWAQESGASLTTQIEILHGAVAGLAAERDGLRAILEQAVEELDGGWRDNGSDLMRDKLVDDFLVAAKGALSAPSDEKGRSDG
jgi:hypothetical protein